MCPSQGLLLMTTEFFFFSFVFDHDFMMDHETITKRTNKSIDATTHSRSFNFIFIPSVQDLP